MFRQEEVFPGGWPDKTVEAMRKRRFEQSIRQMENQNSYYQRENRWILYPYHAQNDGRIWRGSSV